MRKILIVALGLVSLGVSTQLAVARQAKTSTSTGSSTGASTDPREGRIPHSATIRDHRAREFPLRAGPPPAAPKGTVSTAPSNTTDNSPVVRDHRKGGNAENKQAAEWRWRRPN